MSEDGWIEYDEEAIESLAFPEIKMIDGKSYMRSGDPNAWLDGLFQSICDDVMRIKNPYPYDDWKRNLIEKLIDLRNGYIQMNGGNGK